MTFPIGKILESSPNVKRDGATYYLPDELEAVAFLTLGNEILQIPRLERVETGTEVVSFVTHKDERFFFPPDMVVGIKFGSAAKATPKSAGFR